MSEFIVDNFERGMTNNYVNGVKNAGQLYENLLISRNRKPYQRPGSALFDSTLNIIPIGNQRIQFIRYHENFLFEYTANRIYYRDTTFKQLLGPVNSFFAFGDVGTIASHNAGTSWQSHLYTTIDEYVLPRKIYRDENSNWQIRTAGLPSPGDVRGLQTAITLANYMKTVYNAHVNDVVEHKLVSTNAVSPNATDLLSLITLTNELKDLYIAHEADARLTPPIKHQAHIATDDSLDSFSDVFTIDGVIFLLNNIKSHYQDHDSRAVAHTTGGLHPPSGGVDATKSFTVTPESADGKSYLYALVYKYQYNVGTVTYIDRSAPTEVLIDNAGNFSSTSHGNDISNIPVLSNTTFGSKEAWDTANVVVEIYRTSDGGITEFLVDEILNGTTTYEDDSDDTSISENIIIYTDGDVLGNEIPPQCKFVTQANDVMWYCNVQEGIEKKPYRIRHSFQFQPGGSPATFNVDIDGELTGCGTINIFPIVFTENKVFRLEGIVDNLGRGSVIKRIVDNTVGAVSHNSIISVQDGLYFAALDGFYFTDGFKATKLTNHLIDSYVNLIASSSQKKRIYGIYDKIHSLVYWAVQTDAAGSENDSIWVHDPTWGIPNNEGTFTTFDFGDNGQTSALEVVDGDLVRSDARGYTFRHDVDLTTDPVIVTSVNASLWNTTAIIYNYISCAFDFGSAFQRKWVTKLLTLLKAVTNISLLPQSINDDSGALRDLKEYRSRSIFEWGDPFFIWGDPDFIWNAPSTNIAIRRFPRDGIRCTLKQVAYTNADTIIINSDTFGAVTVNATARTATLSSGVFPDDLAGFEIFFNLAENGFTINSQATSVLTLADPLTQLVSGSFSNWVISGVRKGEKFHLENYTIIYEFFGPSHTYFRVGDSGENAS